MLDSLITGNPSGRTLENGIVGDHSYSKDNLHAYALMINVTLFLCLDVPGEERGDRTLSQQFEQVFASTISVDQEK